MQQNITRRGFLKATAAAMLAGPVAASLEEQVLLARASDGGGTPAAPGPKVTVPQGRIGKVKISRLICGGNLISGYAHSRDLIYVSALLKHYFTDEKIMATWRLCEQYGINTMVASADDSRVAAIYRTYREQGGSIQYLAQLSPREEELKKCVQEVVAAGAVGAFLVGNLGDLWTRQGKVNLIGELVRIIRDHGLLAGVAGHELRVPQMVEQAGIAPDFYVKTLHTTNYWSARRSDQTAEVIDNYAIDNYWCRDPEGTIRFFQELERPWLAYKVLAAGALHPRVGFKYAFDNGADFCVVGMFDFQVAEDAALACQAVLAAQNRPRPWMA
jgi:hypothetical protein